MASDSISRDEVKRKLRVGAALHKLLKEQEESLKLGERLATPAQVKEQLYGNPSPSKSKAGRPVSGGHLEPPSSGNPAKERESNSARPALRRERTFDLEPGRSLKDVQVGFHTSFTN